MHSAALLAQPFAALSDLIAAHARERPQHPALEHAGEVVAYGDLHRRVDRIAGALQRDGAAPGSAVAVVAGASIDYVAVFLGALRAGIAVAPLSPSALPEQVAAMAADADATHFFLDAAAADAFRHLGRDLPDRRIAIAGAADALPLQTWLGGDGGPPAPMNVTPEMPFNIIYSSGTTGTPKGIVQPHGMRWAHIQRGANIGYGPEAVTLLSTPLYSNTTLVSLLPTLGLGGTAVLMARFEVIPYLDLAARRRATHTMLVPVQYRRIMAHPSFDAYDLTAFQAKFCTSAPFDAALKADIVKRWPGKLFEIFGMTEGGGTCILAAHEFPGKLHTVGRPVPGHDIRIIDPEGHELPPGQVGEVVGHSPGMMTGYRNRHDQTREAEWFDAAGKRFIRTGDLGRFDEDGFLVLLDRRKDMIISGGFNVYPSDLEAVLRQHPAVADAAVVGVPSERWGETPVAFVVLQGAAEVGPREILAWANARLGKMQRLAAVETLPALPRSAIGKILKRELREAWRPAG